MPPDDAWPPGHARGEVRFVTRNRVGWLLMVGDDGARAAVELSPEQLAAIVDGLFNVLVRSKWGRVEWLVFRASRFFFRWCFRLGVLR